jgi:hypothetical protein
VLADAKRAVDLLPPYFLRDLFQSTEMKVSELVLFKLLLKLTDSLQQEILLRKMVKWQDLTLSKRIRVLWSIKGQCNDLMIQCSSKCSSNICDTTEKKHLRSTGWVYWSRRY